MTFEVILIYLMFWTILREKFTLEGTIVGLLLCSALIIINKKLLKKDLNKQNSLIKNIKYWFQYICILIKEIFVANINVAIIVLRPNLDVSPKTVEFKTNLKSDFCKSILANSITLTPGTITVDIEDNTIKVHCLKKEYMESLIDSKFEKILLKIEG